MDTDLEQIGARCHFCLRQDFLPFRCEGCRESFCLAHSGRDAHNCRHPLLPTAAAAAAPKRNQVTLRDEEAKEKSKSSKALQNDHLSRRAAQSSLGPPAAGSAAVSSRNERDGNPTTLTTTNPLSDRSREALARLKTLGQSFRLRGPVSSTSASTVAQAVRLGRLRREARGDPNVPGPLRLYLSIFKVKTRAEVAGEGTGSLTTTTTTTTRDKTSSDSTNSTKDSGLPFWVNKEWTVGRALDAIASKVSLVNENARTLDESRRLHLFANGLVLEPSQPVARLVKDGDDVYIFRGT